MQKKLLTLSLLFFSINLFAQFIQENEYPISTVKRVYLQDQKEYYVYIDSTQTYINIHNENHGLLNEVPVPNCEGTLYINEVRTDILNADFAIFCHCDHYPEQRYVMDENGVILKEFDYPVTIDSNYIFEPSRSILATKVYNTQTLDSIANFEKFQFGIMYHQNPKTPYYIGNNGRDSIFILNEDLSIHKVITHEPIIYESFYGLRGISRIENGVEEYYFLIDWYDNNSGLFPYTKLINQEGHDLDAPVSSNSKFHKYENDIIVSSSYYTNATGQRLYVYSIDKEEEFQVFPGVDNLYISRSIDDYLAIIYNRDSKEVSEIDYDLSIINTFMLDDPYFYGWLSPFQDHLGNEYYKYIQEVNSEKKLIILKDTEYFQTIDDLINIKVKTYGNNETKLVSSNYRNIFSSKVYSLDMNSSTIDVDDFNVSLSPNPAKDFVNILSDEIIDSYEIYDINGVLINRRNLLNPEMKIDIQQMKSGVYIIRLNKKNGASKVIKFSIVN